MSTLLTDLQRELLSAYVDGEVTDAERATVEALLARADAADYVASLRATAVLVAKHAVVRAPVGMSGRVMGALESEFKPKAIGPGSEPFTSVPILSWRAPLYAAAAAIIVAVAIMFGPALVTPSSSPSVAKGPLDDLPQSDAQGRPEATVMDGLPAPSPAEEPAKDPSMRRSSAGEWGPETDELVETEKLRKESSEVLKTARDLDEAGKQAGTKSDKRADEPLEDKSESGSAEAPGGERERANETGKPDPNRTKGADSPQDDDGGSGGRVAGGVKKGESDREARGGGPKAKLGEVTPPSMPSPSPEAKDEANADGEMTISISDANTIAAQTDVLWIGSLYGTAEVADEESDVESVTVELDPAKLPELLAALRKLAREQGYGVVEGSDLAQEVAREGREQGISGYLPADEPEQATPDAPKAEAEDADEKRPEKVRIVIRLK